MKDVQRTSVLPASTAACAYSLFINWLFGLYLKVHGGATNINLTPGA